MNPTALVRIVSLLSVALAAPAVVLAQRPPEIATTHVDAAVLAQVCAPVVASPVTVTATALTITGGQDTQVRESYTQGDFVTLNAGRNQGIQIGQEFFVRRLQRTRGTPTGPQPPRNIRTTGWIKVYAVDDDMSLATISHACDSIEIDDYLEAFAVRTVPAATAQRGTPERDTYARVMPGADRRRVFGKGDYVLVNRGSSEGVTPGTRFVFYRDKRQPGSFLYEIGEATAVDVKADTATLHVTLSRDAINEGDYVAQRQ